MPGLANDTAEQSATAPAEVRFEFGANWRAFLKTFNSARVEEAERSLCRMLRVDGLQGKTFLDIGSGSGLFSLAAARLGAKPMRSFDYDPNSVGCTAELKRRFFPDAGWWTVERGDVLNESYVRSLGSFDVVYSWGVLHHTGNMMKALEHAGSAVRVGGKLFIAIYNDQGRPTRVWIRIKRLYNALPRGLKWIVTIPTCAFFWGPSLVRDLLLLRPFRSWKTYGSKRGMSPWYDVVDWAGGYPFEAAKPEVIFDFYRARGFVLESLTTTTGSGCNEYVFTRER